MKIKKIVICVIALFFIIGCFTNVYAAAPTKTAKASEIEKYIKDKDNDITKVSIEKLVAWYNTMTTAKKSAKDITSALKNKSKSSIDEYISKTSPEDLKKNVPQDVRSTWSTKCNEGNKQKLSSIADKQETKTTLTEIADPTSDPDIYKPTNANSEKINSKVGPILGIIQNVGMIVSVISLMIIGVKYMLGSVEERADYKKTLLPYIVGAIILFVGSTIPNIIYSALK